LKLPTPLSLIEGKFGKVIVLILLILILIPLYYYIYFFISSGTVNIFDIQLSFVIAALYYLISMLINVPRGNLTLESLLAIRREFFLGRIDLKTAIRQVDIALSGLRAPDVLEGYVTKLLLLFRDASADLHKHMLQIEELETLMSESGSAPSREQEQHMQSLLNSMKQYTDHAGKITKTLIPKTLRSLTVRVYLVDKYATVDDEVKDLLSKLKDSSEELSNRSSECVTRWRKFKETSNIAAIIDN